MTRFKIKIVLYLLFVLLVAVYGIKFKDNDNFLSKERCNSIKGIFILLVFFRHAVPYLSDYPFTGIDCVIPPAKRLMGQLIVVMFLFYSGYGVAIQMEKRGQPYVNQIPRKRLLPTLLNFDVAVLTFVLLNFLLGNTLELKQIALSFIAWNTVGNSNWYIFIILICYFLTYLGCKLCPKYKTIFLIGSSVVIMVLLSFFKASYWYNTILSYSAGWILGLHRDGICKFLKSHYWEMIVLITILFILSYFYPKKLWGLTFNLKGVLFAFLIMMLSMKVIVDNPLIRWCGEHLFPLYIYQRLPMMVMANLLGIQWLNTYGLLFIFASLAITCVIACFFKYLQFK